jgi:hypothetical protein
VLEAAVDEAVHGAALEEAALVSSVMAARADAEVVALARAMWNETHAKHAAATAQRAKKKKKKKTRLVWAYVCALGPISTRLC